MSCLLACVYTYSSTISANTHLCTPRTPSLCSNLYSSDCQVHMSFSMWL